MREYKCEKCGRTVNKLLSLKDKAEAIICSVCGSTEMQILSEPEKLNCLLKAWELEVKKLKTTSIVIYDKHLERFLGVSRKDNHNSFGFAGGKKEETDENIIQCAARELREETGLDPISMNMIDIREYVNRDVNPPTLDTVYLFVIRSYRGTLHSNEELKKRGEGILKWVTEEELLAGAFGDYNAEVLPLIYKFLNIKPLTK